MLCVTRLSVGSVFGCMLIALAMLFGAGEVMAHCGSCPGDQEQHESAASCESGKACEDKGDCGSCEAKADEHKDHDHAEHVKKEKGECKADCTCEKCEAKKAAKAKDEDCGGDSCPLEAALKAEKKEKSECGKSCSGATCTKCMPKVSGFDQVGEVRKLTGFFDAAKKEKKSNGKLDSLTDLVLVTNKGVYHFIETPANREALSSIENGQKVHAKGKAYNHGGLVYLDGVKVLDKKEASKVKLNAKQFSSAKGQKVVLEGVNGCQCQLDVGELPHSCKLGHLHHMQDEKGRIFNYIPTAKSYDLIKGQKGTHGKKIKVEGIRLPGNSLLVTKVSK
ncbi:hypothetical protein JD969_09985 [Planctomycetota bacterium]|nr:hypothetical protein JD969_09985 [Planctomycetota bacterium]